MKLCKDCKHFNPDSLYSMKCNRPMPPIINLVTGEEAMAKPMCNNERYSDFPDRCGREAKFFEEKKTIWKRFVEFAMKPATNLGPM